MSLHEILEDGFGDNLILNRIERALKRTKQHENVRFVVKGYQRVGPYDAIELEIEGHTFRVEVKELT